MGLLLGLAFALALGGFNRRFDEEGNVLSRSTLAEAVLVYSFGLGLVGAAVGAIRGYRVLAGAALGWLLFFGYALARLPDGTSEDKAQWLMGWTNFGLLGGGLLSALVVAVFLLRGAGPAKERSQWE